MVDGLSLSKKSKKIHVGPGHKSSDILQKIRKKDLYPP